MAYFKINDIDFSMYVSNLIVYDRVNYNSATNANYDTVIDYINSKREIEVEIIPLNDSAMSNLLREINRFEVYVAFRNPRNNTLTETLCIIPENSVEYYTIQSNKVLYKAFTLRFIEL